MIVVDTSALLAILFSEPDRALFERALSLQERNVISAVNVHEATIVLRMRQGTDAVEMLWRLLRTHAVEIIGFDETQLDAAADAFNRFGKGVHARARLNLCDCAAYALAKTMGAPLLFKGDDFSHADIEPAL